METEIKNSENYINQKIGKNTGFSIPSNYFDSLEDVIAVKLVEENLAKENGFVVPDNYFDNLEDIILAKVSSTKKEPKIISLKSRVLKLIPYAAAASILLFIGLNSFVFNADDKLTIDSITDAEIEYWLESTPLNTNDIAIILEDDIIDENDFYFSTIKDESIEDYINSIDNIALLTD